MGDLGPDYPNAQYLLEHQVITPDETSVTRNNNVSYRTATVGAFDANLCCYTNPCTEIQKVCDADRSCTPNGCSSLYSLTMEGSTSFCQEPAIRAWKDSDPCVVESDQLATQDPDDALFILAAKARNIVPGSLWEYEYALHNMNSDRSAGTFSVPLPTDVGFQIQNIGFHDVDYHSGEELQFDGTYWPATVTTGSITWATTAHATNPNANSLRWGTLYNFRFQANRGPNYAATVTIGLFKTPQVNLTPVSVAPAALAGPGPGGCIAVAAPQQDAPEIPRNRFLSLIPPSCSVLAAIRVKLIDLQNPDPPNIPANPPPNFSAYESATCTAANEANGCARWVGKPQTFLEAQDSPATGNFRAARLQCTPFYYDWSGESVVQVTGAEIVPSSTYSVQMIAQGCSVAEEASYSTFPLSMTTARSGDVEALFQAPSPAPLSQPDVIDVAQLVNKFKNLANAPVKARSQLQPNLLELNADLNALDIVAVVNAIKGIAYPFSGPCPCPSAVTCGSHGPPVVGTSCATPGVCVDTFGAGSLCVKTCTGGENAGNPCINDTHCSGGACENPFCRDRCGRCSP